MLVLTRKKGQKIQIGDDITLTVVRVKGKGVRLGIQASANVPVMRAERADEDERATSPRTNGGAS